MKVAQDSEEAGGAQQTFALPYIDGFTRVEFFSKAFLASDLEQAWREA